MLLYATPILGLLSNDLLDIIASRPNHEVNDMAMGLIEHIEQVANDIDTAAAHANVSRTSPASIRSSKACALLRLIFSGSVITPSSSRYISEQDFNWWDSQSSTSPYRED